MHLVHAGKLAFLLGVKGRVILDFVLPALAPSRAGSLPQSQVGASLLAKGPVQPTQ
ncbi:hypothetical protein EMIT0P260_50313 [Pseudomonas sp. IT-P260]